MLKIRLEKWERAVVMQVLEQSIAITEELREKEFSNGEMVLSSEICPEFSCSSIFVRGSDSSSDFDVCVEDFDSNQNRDEYYYKIVNLFSDFNNRKKDCVDEDSNIFILE